MMVSKYCNLHSCACIYTFLAHLPISVIQVEFQDKEYSIDESVGEKQVHFIISNPIIVDTHFLVLALTYQQFDEQYEALNATYPGLDPFTLNDEYDQAECKYEWKHVWVTNSMFVLCVH